MDMRNSEILQSISSLCDQLAKSEEEKAEKAIVMECRMTYLEDQLNKYHEAFDQIKKILNNL